MDSRWTSRRVTTRSLGSGSPPVGGARDISRTRSASGREPRRQPALLADAKRLGAGYMALTNRHPGILPTLLRWFDSTGREILLRKLLLAMHVPPRLLALIGVAAPGRNRRELWFGFVSRFAFWSAVRGSVSRHRWRQLTRGVPVLIYHAFEDDASPGTRFVLPRARFRAHLRALGALRYQVISLETLVRALREGDLPPRAVVITIDDGYRDNFADRIPGAAAIPLLR